MSSVPAYAFLSAAVRSRLMAVEDAVWDASAVYTDHSRPDVFKDKKLWLVVAPPTVDDEPVTARRKNVSAVIDIAAIGFKTEIIAQAVQQIIDALDHTGRFDTGSKDELVLTSLATPEARRSWVITAMWHSRDTGLEITRNTGARLYARPVRFIAKMESSVQYA